MSNTNSLAIEEMVQSQSGKDITFNEAINILDVAHGALNKVVTTGTYTLTADEYRCGVIRLTGSLLANVIIKFPLLMEKMTFFINNTVAGGFTITLQKGTSGVSALLPAAGRRLVWYDDSTGMNVESLTE